MNYRFCLALACICSVAIAGEIAEHHGKLQVSERGPSPDSRSRSELAPVEHGVTEIGIERAGQPGKFLHPMYIAVMGSDGLVRYRGIAGVKQLGEATGKIHPSDFNRLAMFLVKAGYMELDSTYSGDALNASGVYTTAVRNGERRVILNYDNRGPEDLWAIEQLIDHTLTKVVWDRPTTSTATIAP
ncbi:MAG TPA: DUF6438 domain-containing protein [Candidatus Hydrogenedentes bacterium]|nr:DUF6438 domain-containing protein [Candidatus Hydrogenedentota bacterium]